MGKSDQHARRRVETKRRAALGVCTALLVLAGGCVSVAEHRKLEERVLSQQRSPSGESRRVVADLRAELRRLEERVNQLEGRLESAEHETRRAQEEARRARQEAARVGSGTAPGTSPPPGDGSTPTGNAAAAPPDEPSAPAAVDGRPPPAPSSEVSAYRNARTDWREGRWDDCIDRFGSFLQTYPASGYADDAAFWLADCHFKRGDYKTAVVRFDDVVVRYPEGERSADALYRQGEALLRLGPGYSKAASRAFERVMKEYPSSPRAQEAKRQLELLRPR